MLCQLLTLWVLWLMAEGSWTQTLIGLDTRLPVTGLPLAVFNAAALYAAAAMGLLTLVDLVRVWRAAPAGRIQRRESAGLIPPTPPGPER